MLKRKAIESAQIKIEPNLSAWIGDKFFTFKLISLYGKGCLIKERANKDV